MLQGHAVGDVLTLLALSDALADFLGMKLQAHIRLARRLRAGRGALRSTLRRAVLSRGRHRLTYRERPPRRYDVLDPCALHSMKSNAARCHPALPPGRLLVGDV